MKFIILDSLDSTNSYLKENMSEIPDRTLIIAREQRAGRGQRGNSWEAEPGKNLTFSFQFTPENIRPSGQFAISEAVALAVGATLREYGIATKLKWPNDIYAGNRKICGILIENSIFGMQISRCIVGVGLNVNQRTFRSDAPNPVSMSMLTGKEYEIEEVAGNLCRNFDLYLSRLTGETSRRSLHTEYLSSLWRGDGKYHEFRIPDTEETFKAVIHDIEPTGHIMLKKRGGEISRFAFKEIIFA